MTVALPGGDLTRSFLFQYALILSERNLPSKDVIKVETNKGLILCIFTGILDNDFCPLLSVENEFNDIPKLFTAFGKKQNIWLKYARNLAFIQ